MTTQIVKSILIGMLVGATFFVMPFFIVRTILFLFLIAALFRFFAGRRARWGYSRGFGFHPAFTDTIRRMSDDEYEAFRQKMSGGCYDGWRKEDAPKSSPV